MIYVDNENHTDPRVNLAIEEHLLRNLDIDIPMLLFYINEPSVIIGRNQNTIEEIDPEYVEKEGIHVVRRLSGGGAVYHDLGNLNFSFITPGRAGLHDFSRFTQPVLNVLRNLGVIAELRGKSDLFASGKKFSGNAQFASAGRMFSHGTLLFDTNIEDMLRALNPRRLEIESKAVRSVRNYVTNIRELLSADMTIQELKQAILHDIFRDGEIQRYELTGSDWTGIQAITSARYSSWDWNFGRSPEFNVSKSDQTAAGKIDVRIDVKHGVIRGVRFFGDFIGRRPVHELEEGLKGLRYEREALARALATSDLDAYFGEMSGESLLALLY